jgi:hypothetical protein
MDILEAMGDKCNSPANGSGSSVDGNNMRVGGLTVPDQAGRISNEEIGMVEHQNNLGRAVGKLEDQRKHLTTGGRGLKYRQIPAIYPSPLGWGNADRIYDSNPAVANP